MNPRALLLTISAIAMASTIVLPQLSASSPEGSLPAKLAPAMRVESAQIQTASGYTFRRVFSGRVEAARRSDLGFEQGGLLREVRVRDGDHVQQGQVLARMDRDRLEAQRQELVAGLAEVRANRDLANATLKRMSRIVNEGGVSRQGLDEAREGFRAAGAQVRLMQRRIDSLDVELAKTDLKAPFDGVIIRRAVDEGRVLAAGQAVLSIQETARPEIRIGLAGRLVDGLEEGETYSMTWRGTSLQARLRSVLPMRADAGRTVDALFDVLDAPTNLRPGDLVTLGLTQQVEEAGFWLPMTALTEGRHGLWSVYVTEGLGDAPEGLDATHRVQRRSVDVLHQETGAHGERVFVRGPIGAEEHIVLHGLQRIVPGQWVRLVPRAYVTNDVNLGAHGHE